MKPAVLSQGIQRGVWCTLTQNSQWSDICPQLDMAAARLQPSGRESPGQTSHTICQWKRKTAWRKAAVPGESKGEQLPGAQTGVLLPPKWSSTAMLKGKGSARSARALAELSPSPPPSRASALCHAVPAEPPARPRHAARRRGEAGGLRRRAAPRGRAGAAAAMPSAAAAGAAGRRECRGSAHLPAGRFGSRRHFRVAFLGDRSEGRGARSAVYDIHMCKQLLPCCYF